MTDWLINTPILLAVGALAGTIAGLLGVGGGIVIVPVLYWLVQVGLMDVQADIAIQFAVATSLMTIIPTSISSARAHHRKGNIDVDLFKAWMPWMALGALIGGVLASNASSKLLSGVFIFVATIVIVNMLSPKQFTLAEKPPSSNVGRAATAIPIGLFSAMMGIGGGSLSVPALALYSFPMIRAVGTAALFGLVIALPGIIGYALAGQDIQGLLPYSVGFINIPAAVIISMATFFFAPIGVSIASSLDPNRLRLVFALFLGISALKMLIDMFF